ncbi:uncharacterized protein K452DRAFT_229184 [Aplosporella prunicola CBS 121167]|uniref:Isoleucine--tRNA ligase, mitochondrial n=1 Tax=Aplosporella prunicola CBS 121167 TaxID=1176127 RepID=A0A6A6BAC0_9PEZI|nr:uncharacterized protein K452DRAFT_229184 [Aplosporella prunicola CBS 121167]KAF2141020.1 hypothetical protein K452DRAFT_229184 [Aplosporella prunicola CBS 121167]
MVAPTQILRSATNPAPKSWSSSLKLPKSAFPPRPAPSTDYLRQVTDDLYAWQQSPERQTKSTFVLHDGPPYANGNLHIGHALNKILKDLICRFHVGQGKKVDYIPGWDCHGLPIELKALQSLTDAKRERLGPVGVRAAARHLAEKTVEQQMEGFRKWAIMGDWNNAYRTMEKGFEMRQLGIFKAMVEKGLIYRQYKPVYWSPSSGTALAEAELEYDDNHRSQTAYVSFPIVKVPESLAGRVDMGNFGALIWTTTPWTLPANNVIGVHSTLEYSVVKMSRPTATGNRPSQFLVAKSRIEALQNILKTEFQVLVDSISGAELAGQIEYTNPLDPEQVTPQQIVHADFVSAASGSGLVHMAAGHGMDDYNVCRSLGIPAFAPVDDKGCFTQEALPGQAYRIAGLPVQGEGSKAILDLLKNMPRDPLIAVQDITHKYPIDWRTKKPVIVRATEQWFADVEEIKTGALDSLEAVKFWPQSAKARLESFIRGRSQWCVSRQRAWGVPIPALYNKDNGEAHMTVGSIEHIMGVIEQRGIDAWWTDPEDDPAWVPAGLEGSFIRGRDTMDVWFDSGTSWTLLDAKPGRPVADVYLEGTDQHRGWFQSSLLTYIAHQAIKANKGHISQDTKFAAPFKALITHGFTLDQDGRKMSKSLGNTVSPEQIMDGSLLPPLKLKKKQKKEGASANTDGNPTYDAMGPDALRLWVASSDYTKDVVIGQPILLAVNQGLHKYRVTFKWLLGVLADFDPSAPVSESIKTNDHALIDTIALHQLSRTAHAVHAAYGSYEFSRGVGALSKYTTQSLSAFYFETLKDRLYAGTPADRYSAQQVLHKIFNELLDMLAPVTPLLVEEVWSFTPDQIKNGVEKPGRRTWTPFLTETYANNTAAERMDSVVACLTAAHSAVKSAQEASREQKLIGSGLECEVVFRLPVDTPNQVKALFLAPEMEEQLAEIFVVSGVEVVVGDEEPSPPKELPSHAVKWASSEKFDVGADEGSEAKATVRPAHGEKCPRCWRYVAPTPEELCHRCKAVVPEA